MIRPVQGRGARTAIIRGNEVTTQNHSGGGSGFAGFIKQINSARA